MSKVLLGKDTLSSWLSLWVQVPKLGWKFQLDVVKLNGVK
jgi:hypothetical protein